MAALKITKLVGTCLLACVATAGVTAVQLNGAEDFTWAGALENFPQWLNAAPNPWLLLTTVISAGTGILGAWAAIAQLRAPNPLSEKEARKQHDRVKRSFETLDDRTQAGLQDLKEGRSEDSLKIDEILVLLKAQGGTGGQQLETAAEEVRELAQSADPADREVARIALSGDTREAYAELVAEARDGKLRNAERFRQAARLIAPFEPGKAKAAYEEATQLDPTDFWSWIELGRLRAVYDGLQAARNCFNLALQQVTDERDRMVLHNEFGNLLLAESQLGEAENEYAAGLAIAQRLVARDESNALWQNDLSVSLNKLGRIEQQAGNFDAARQRYEAALAIAETLSQREPGDAEWQRDLSISHERLGDIERQAGFFDAARQRYAAALTIRETLSQSEPGNAEWQRDLSVSYNKLGDIEQQLDNLNAARLRYAAALAIRETLNKREPDNAGWQRDLWASNSKLGGIAFAEGDAALARAHFRKAEDVMAALAARWPDHPGFADDLALVRKAIAQIEAEDDGPG